MRLRLSRRAFLTAGAALALPGRLTRTRQATYQDNQITARVGERVDGEYLSMVVRDVHTTDAIGEFQEADSGNEYVVVRVAVKNTSDQYLSFSEFLQTRIRDDEGYSYRTAFAVTNNSMSGGQLVPGEVERGDLVFEVPTDSTGRVLQFDFESFDLFDTDRVLIDLEASMEEIADLEQNFRVEIHERGDGVEYEAITVTVNGARTEQSLSLLAESDEGKEYVIVDVSVLNETGEEQHVSTLLQMLVKDGDGNSYGEDIFATSALDQPFDQGSPLVDGELRRGEIAYETPETFEVLYWVFEFTLWVDGDKTFWRIR